MNKVIIIAILIIYCDFYFLKRLFSDSHAQLPIRFYFCNFFMNRLQNYCVLSENMLYYICSNYYNTLSGFMILMNRLIL